MTDAPVRSCMPREVALRILAWRYPDLDGDSGAARAQPVIDLARFQADAVERAEEILAARRGVVVADSVGLGKTFIGLALVERAVRRGERVAVTAPAPLRRDWTGPLRRLARELSVRSTWGLRPGRAGSERGRTEPDGRRDGLVPGRAEPEGRDDDPAPSRAAPEGRHDDPVPSRAAPDGRGNELVQGRAAAEPRDDAPQPGRADRRRDAAGPGVGRAPDHPFIGWVSHARLSRGTYPARRLARLDLVVVDEAHAFRSPKTRRYRALAELCRGVRVVLLTATPVNNSTMDLYHLLHLFAADGDFRDLGIADLREAFRRADAERRGFSGPWLGPLLGAVVIRRTRPFLRDHYRGVRVPAGAMRARGRGRAPRAAGSGSTPPGRGSRRTAPALLEFPRRAPPVPVRYGFDPADPGFTARILDSLTALTFAALRATEYAEGAPDGAGPARETRGQAELVRVTLLKRLDSSLAAFRASVVRQLHFHEAFLDALARGRLLSATDHRALHGMVGDGDVAQLILHEVASSVLPSGLDSEGLHADAASDAVRLRALRREVDRLLAGNDPKLQRLIELLDGGLYGQKVVLFTEFRDTARFLWRALRHRSAVGLVDGAGAFLGQAPCARRAVIDRFAPRANGVRDPPPRERVDTLVATDVLAEGLNLQDAGCVVSYDLPWNPVRLIQRVGRIDRIGSLHTVIRSYHFVPDGDLDGLLGLFARLRAKLGAIGRTIGAEGAVLGAEQEGARDFNAFVDRLAAGDPGALDAIERAEAAPFELEERLRAAYMETLARPAEAAAPGRASGSAAERRRSEARGPDGSAEGAALAPDAAHGRCVAVEPDAVSGEPARVGPGTAGDGPPSGCTLAAALRGPPAGPHRILVACRAVGRLALRVGSPGADALTADPSAAARVLLHALQAPPADALPISHTALQQALDAVETVVTSERAMATAPEPVPANAPGARAARRLLRTLAHLPGGPDPGLCDRADTLLQALARRHDAGTEAAVDRVLGAASKTVAGSANGPGATPARVAAGLITALEHALAPIVAPADSGAAPEGSARAATERTHEQHSRHARSIAILEVRPC